MYIIFLSRSLLLSAKKLLSHFANQNPCVDMNTLFDLTLASNLFPTWNLYWLLKFTILVFVLNSIRFHIARLVCNRMQKKPMENRESYMLIHKSNHNNGSNNWLSMYHLPTDVSNESCFTLVNLVKSIDFYDSSFHYSDAC